MPKNRNSDKLKIMAKKMGRPTIYSQKMATEICKRLTEGNSLRSICRDPQMPELSTVIAWRAEKKDFSSQYEKAREDQADTLSDELLDIADDGQNDFIEKALKDGSTMIVPDIEHIQRSRLRVDTRKWIASKLKPKRYGDRLNMDHSGKVAFEDLLDEVQKAPVDKKE